MRTKNDGHADGQCSYCDNTVSQDICDAFGLGLLK